MKQHLSLIVLAVLSVTPNIAYAESGPYSTDAFSADCRLSGGAPRILNTIAICENSKAQHITCLRQGNAVHGCTLENVSRGATDTTPRTKTTPIQRRLLNDSLR